jgi:hypothetical protein
MYLGAKCRLYIMKYKNTVAQRFQITYPTFDNFSDCFILGG